MRKYLALLVVLSCFSGALRAQDISLTNPDADSVNWATTMNTNLDTIKAAVCDKRTGKTCTIAGTWTFTTPFISSTVALNISSATLNFQTIFNPSQGGISTFTSAGIFQIPRANLDLAGLTAGSVLFVDSSESPQQDNANLFWDDTNNRLGIGTTAPGVAFDTNGSGIFRSTLTVSGSQFDVGTSTFRVLSGNVGVGTSNPTSALQVIGSQIVSSTLTVEGAQFSVGSSSFRVVNGQTGVGTESPKNLLDVRGASHFGAETTVSTITSTGQLQLVANSTVTSNGTLTISTASAASASLNPVIFLNGLGNVGIGVGLPVSRLDVTGGEIRASTLTLAGSMFQLQNPSGQNRATIDNDGLLTVGSATLSGLTSGSVLFSGSSGRISQDNSNAFWDDTNNRLGIGTTAPGVAFDVNGSGIFRSTLTVSGAEFDVGTSTFRVLSGNVGIGTSNPTSALQIIGSQIISSTLTVEGKDFSIGTSTLVVTNGLVGIATTNPRIRLNVDNGTDITLSGVTGFGAFGTMTGNHVSIDNDTIQAKQTDTTAAQLLVNPLGGSVGIGTAVPVSTLTVNGPASFGDLTTRSTFTASGALNLATQLTIANGGTGATTLTDNGVLFGNGTSAIGALPAMTDGGIVIGTGAEPSTGTIVATTDETTVSATAGSITIGIADPLIVGKGGSGAATFTDGGLLFGNGTSAFGALPVPTDGGIVIGTGGDPSTGTVVATTDETTVSATAGSITIGIADPLIVGKGGTGAATLTSNGILFGNGTGSVQALPAMAGATGIIVGNSSVAPTTGTLQGSANIVVSSNSTGLTITASGLGTGDALLASTQTFTGRNTFTNTAGGSTAFFTVSTNTATGGAVAFRVEPSSGIATQRVPSVRVSSGAATAIADNTATALGFTSERWDNDAMHDNSTNNTRLTANTAGLYLITATVGWADNTTGQRCTLLKVGGSTIIADQCAPTPTGARNVYNNVTTVYTLSAGEYVEVLAYQNSGGQLNVITEANVSPEFGMTYLGEIP